MKKLLLLTLFLTLICTNNYAQIPVGSVVSNFKYKDINGNTIELYKLLDSGYTVLIDISATWCGPCWTFHTSNTMKNLMNQYGPNGTVEKGKIYCIFIEGDATTPKSYLNGPAASGITQGDWVTGANYPIIDTAAYNGELGLSGFPTLVMICPNRTVIHSQGGTTTASRTAQFWVDKANQANCKAPILTTTVDFLVNNSRNTSVGSKIGFGIAGKKFNVNSTIYNNSKTKATSFTAKVKYKTTDLITKTFNGSYSIVDSFSKITLNDIVYQDDPSFTGYFNTNYTVSVDATNDVNTSNNSATISNMFVYTKYNAKTFPYTEDFETVDVNITDLPESSRLLSTTQLASVPDNAAIALAPIGNDDTEQQMLNIPFNAITSTTNANFRGFSFINTMFNVNVPNDGKGYSFEFDYAKKRKNLNEKDTVKVFAIYNDTIKILKIYTGDSILSVTGTSTSFTPVKAGDWKTKSVSLNDYRGLDNVILGFIFVTGEGGNALWIDKVSLKSSTSISSSSFTLTAGDTAFKNDTKTTSVLAPSLYFKNIKGQNLTAKWKVRIMEYPANWDQWELCDINVCHPAGKTSDSFALSKDSTGYIKINFNTKKLDGYGYLRVSVYDTKDSANSLLVLKFSAKQGTTQSITQIVKSEDFFINDNKIILTNDKLIGKEVEIFNLNGKLVQKFVIDNKINSVSLPSNGVYLIDIYDGVNVQSTKMIYNK
jgi:hypothetical protein